MRVFERMLKEIATFVRDNLFNDMQEIIQTARCAGIDRNEIMKIFMAALAETCTRDECAVRSAKIQEQIKEGKEWAKAHPEAMAQNPLNWLKEDEEEGPRAD
jgi:hypothetical protein